MSDTAQSLIGTALRLTGCELAAKDTIIATLPAGYTIDNDVCNALIVEANRLGRALTVEESRAVIEGWRGKRE